MIQRETGSKVAIIDVDYHHGNGTQEIFWSDTSILTVSLHGHPDFEYPYFTGRADELGADGAGNLNLPLPKGTTGEEFLTKVAHGLERAVDFGATYLVMPFGADIAREDPMGTFELDPEHFASIGAAFAATGLPVLTVQEGGYDIGATASAVAALLDGLENGPRSPSSPGQADDRARWRQRSSRRSRKDDDSDRLDDRAKDDEEPACKPGSVPLAGSVAIHLG